MSRRGPLGLSSMGKVTGTPYVPDTYRLTLCLTPRGRLVLASADDAPEMDGALARRIQQAFAKGAGHGLLR